jgi:hypothetical protein
MLTQARLLLFTLLLVSWTGCKPPLPLEMRLEAPDPATRMRAVLEINRNSLKNQVPALVERLLDADPGVRVVTILGLERLTGTRLGYDAGAAPAERRAAYFVWQRYLVTEGLVSIGPDPVS